MSKNKKSKKKNQTRCEYCGKPTTVKYDDEYCCHSCHNEIETQNAYEIVGIWSDD